MVLISSIALPRVVLAQDVDLDPPAAPAPTDGEPGMDPPPTAVVKDLKLAKKWRAAGTTLQRQGDAATKKAKPEDAKQHYENALTAYLNAFAASDDLNIVYDIASVNEKLGRLDIAATHYRKLVTMKVGVKADVLKKATARLDDMMTKIGAITLTVEPDGTTISLWGAEIGKSPLAKPLLLLPGAYTFSFSADGFQPKDAELKVEAGSESERAIDLEAVKIIVTAPTPDHEPPVEVVEPQLPSKLPMLVGVSVAGAAVITAVITGLMAQHDHSTFVAPDSTRTEREDARVSGENLALTTDIAIGVGVVAVGFTAGWYLFKYGPAMQKFDVESRPQPTRSPTLSMAKVSVVPWVKSDAGGFVFAGAF